MDTVDIWRRVLIGAIVAVLVAVAIGGVYLLYAWSKVGSDSGLNDSSLTPIEQQRKALDTFTAPAPTTTPVQGAITTQPESPQTPSEFDAPAQPSGAGAQGQGDVPPTPSSFDAPV